MVTHEPEMAAMTHRILHFRDGKIERDERLTAGETRCHA
jgi:putative ABC transport system ATP-binding protein